MTGKAALARLSIVSSAMPMDLPSAKTKAAPRTIIMVESVVMSGLILKRATTTPLTSPTNAPKARAVAVASARPPPWRNTSAHSTPPAGMSVPTERSKLPEARQNSIVVATMPTVETCSSRFMMFSGDPKLRTVSQQTRMSAPRMSCMPARSSRARKGEAGLGDSELMVRRRGIFRGAGRRRGRVPGWRRRGRKRRRGSPRA